MTITHKAIKVPDVAKGKADWHLYTDYCKGCGLCIVKCPKKCLNWSKEVGIYQTPAVEPTPEECIACGTCELVCPDNAIRVEKKV
ncbi:TPA: 4Fe-4S binding protein [Candidatus Galligastranaerophilus faecipullorum]|nr:4Fe-4S binding protein [Candidatus Galligastranaerophilus faecipullorum]